MKQKCGNDEEGAKYKLPTFCNLLDTVVRPALKVISSYNMTGRHIVTHATDRLHTTNTTVGEIKTCGQCDKLFERKHNLKKPANDRLNISVGEIKNVQPPSIVPT